MYDSYRLYKVVSNRLLKDMLTVTLVLCGTTYGYHEASYSDYLGPPMPISNGSIAYPLWPIRDHTIPSMAIMKHTIGPIMDHLWLSLRVV